MSELEVNRLKADYNYWNNREVKAEIFFRKNADEVTERHIKAYIEILHQLSLLQQKIEKAINRKMTDKEIFGGFEEVNKT